MGLLSGAAIVWAVLSGQTPAEAGTYEMEGHVRGPSGEAVVEAKVALYDPNNQLVEMTDTDQAGRFRIPAIGRGTYVLEVMAEGFVKLRQPLLMEGPVTDIVLQMHERGALETVVRKSTAPLPPQDGTTTGILTQRDFNALPGGTSRPLYDAVATQQGVTRDNFGAIHVRGNFAGLLLRLDGIPLPAAVQDRLEQLLESQVVSDARVIVGGLPAEYGQQVGGVLDVHTVRPTVPEGEVRVSYGTYNDLQGQANMAGTLGPVSALVAGSLETTDRGLDPPAASPILHDQLHGGRAFLRLDDALGPNDRVELLSLYAEGHFQIPIDPTLLPLSAGPANAQRGTDPYGNTAGVFVPYNSNPTELERDFFGAVSWFHDFGPHAQLQLAPFIRFQTSDLLCDTAHQLGPTADPGTTCSDVHHKVLTGGLILNQDWRIGRQDFKAGALVNVQKSQVGYSEYTRDDAAPLGGADPSQTVTGEDTTDLFLAGVYLQDTISLGRLTVLPGLRADVQTASVEGAGATPTLWGPSFRLGAAYAFSEDTVGHAFIGQLWQPPTLDAPLAARVLGLVPPGQAVPFDLQAETDEYAEIGVATRVLQHLSVSTTAWGRLSRYTLDDNEVGDTALTADYNYERGRAAGLEISGLFIWSRRFRAFANATVETAEGEGIASARYLFTPQQLAFTGYQAVDNANLLSANAGFDWSDSPGMTHLSALVRFSSGLRTGPTNNATLPPNTVVDLTVRHRFDVPLRPELALDVRNLFDVIYAYRIATGSLSGTAYGALRELDVRLSIPLGG